MCPPSPPPVPEIRFCSSGRAKRRPLLHVPPKPVPEIRFCSSGQRSAAPSSCARNSVLFVGSREARLTNKTEFLAQVGESPKSGETLRWARVPSERPSGGRESQARDPQVGETSRWARPPTLSAFPQSFPRPLRCFPPPSGEKITTSSSACYPHFPRAALYFPSAFGMDKEGYSWMKRE